MIAPLKDPEHVGTFEISVTVKDNNLNSLKATYSFNINVEGLPLKESTNET
jgi:hypothetical protein